MRYLHTALITLLLVSTSEGGIRQLTKYLTTGTFLKSWKEADKQHPQYFDHVCIDMNEILHGIHNLNVPSHFTFAKMLFHRLDYLLDIVVPKSSLVMAFDGPAPFAKIQTQQLRRMMESDISRYTPGTIFMNKMEDMATSYVLKKLQQPLYRNISVFISGPDCPGEGELKLLNWVHNIMPSVSDSVAMCGRDGDVVVQAMTLHNITNRYVVQGHRPASICNISSLMENLAMTVNPSRYYSHSYKDKEPATVINNSISHNTSSSVAFGKEKKSPYFNKSNKSFKSSVSPQVTNDIIALFSLQGNDYLPSLHTIPRFSVLSIYGEMHSSLNMSNKDFLLDTMNSNTFNFSFLLRLFMKMVQSSPYSVLQPWQALLHPRTILHDLIDKGYIVNDTEWTSVHDKSTNKFQATLRIGNMTFAGPLSASLADTQYAATLTALESLNKTVYDQFILMDADAKEALVNRRKLVLNEIYRKKETVDKHMREEDLSKLDYSAFVRDSDIEQYLSGLLWIVEMYITGKCPDVGFTFAGRWSPSPRAIVAYIQRKVNMSPFNITRLYTSEEDVNPQKSLSSFCKSVLDNNILSNSNDEIWNELKDKIKVPRSDTRKYLSSSAVCTYLLQEEAVKHIPLHLRDLWQNIRFNMSESLLTPTENMTKSTLNKKYHALNVTYDSVCDELREIWRVESLKQFNSKAETYHTNGTSTFPHNSSIIGSSLSTNRYDIPQSASNHTDTNARYFASLKNHNIGNLFAKSKEKKMLNSWKIIRMSKSSLPKYRRTLYPLAMRRPLKFPVYKFSNKTDEVDINSLKTLKFYHRIFAFKRKNVPEKKIYK